MGRNKDTFTDIQEALANKDIATLKAMIHTDPKRGEAGDLITALSWGAGTFIYGYGGMQDLEQYREGLETLFEIGGAYVGDSRTVCHTCAHLFAILFETTMDGVPNEGSELIPAGEVTIRGYDPMDIPVNSYFLRCPCDSLLAVRVTNEGLERGLEGGYISPLGASWYYQLNEECGFSGDLSCPTNSANWWAGETA